jgi:hypothetical protein
MSQLSPYRRGADDLAAGDIDQRVALGATHGLEIDDVDAVRVR